MPDARRFPIPWSVEDIGAAYVVKDANGQKLAYVYYEEEPGRRSPAKLLSRDYHSKMKIAQSSSKNSIGQIDRNVMSSHPKRDADHMKPRPSVQTCLLHMPVAWRPHSSRECKWPRKPQLPIYDGPGPHLALGGVGRRFVP